MTLQLGGRGDESAIFWRGRTYSYATLDASISGWPLQDMYDASSLDLPDAMACVCAAARHGRAVAVLNPDALPAPHAEWPGGWLNVATSGSSGNPKPLTRTVESWTDSFPEFTTLTGLTKDDAVLITGPLHATMHLFGAVHALWLGACITDNYQQATAIHAVPAVLRTLVSEAPKLTTAITAGIALDPGARDLAVANGVRVVEYYGAAELSVVAARVVPHPLRIFAGVDAELRDGVLWVRSPFRALGVEEWFSVGDLASIGPEGELTVHGRANAAINVGGTTVIAEHVEATLSSVPGVNAVAVLGTPHSVLGETVVAVVELTDAYDLGSVRAAARELLSREAMPRRWCVTESLARTPAGKIDRARVRAEMA